MKKLKAHHSSLRVKKRPDWDEYFIEIAKLISERSTCLRRAVGALIVKNRRILTTGYNGTPTGITHCEVTGCLREKLNVPSGERHELCLPPDESIFTDEGYVPISEVKLGRRVLTHKGIYRKVTQIFKRKYNGTLCHIEPWNLLPTALTPNHPVLILRAQKCQYDTRTLCKETCKSVNKKYCTKPYLNYESGWLPACEIKEKDIVLLPYDNRDFAMGEIDFSFVVDTPAAYHSVLEERGEGKSYAEIKGKLNVWPSTANNWVKGGVPRNCIAVCDDELKHGSSPSKPVPAKVKLSKEFLRIIGFYLAEGCSSLNQLSFSFHRKETDFIEEVKSAMKKIFDLNCYEDIRDNSHKVVYSSIILAKAFKILFGADAYSKKLPHFLTRLSPEHLRHILAAYVQGDGYKIDDNTTTVTTASKNLALQVMQILLKLGYIPMIDIDRDKYRLIWKNKHKIAHGYFRDHTYFTPVRKIWTSKYSGYVYNLEVEHDNSYVTKSFTVHNCRGLHAEQNAIIQAALYGVDIHGGTLYCTNQPCSICAKMLINAGIKEIVMESGYPDEMAKEFFKEAGVNVRTSEAGIKP